MTDLNDIKIIQGKLNHSYLNGVYLALNAIPDAYLLLDGTICAFSGMFSVHKTHDLLSDLVRQNTKHKVCCTGAMDHTVVHDRSELVNQFLFKLREEKDCSVIFICSYPMATVIGLHYDRIINMIQKQIITPLMEIPSRSMQEDWLSGYEETLLTLARNVDLRPDKKKSDHVAVVGYLFDRNEGDHIGNLKEIERIFKNLSLNCVSVWLSGSSFKKLHHIEKAGTIISLPYARRAAREIARKTGADLIELNLPFGMGGTREWISTIGKKLKRVKQAEFFIKRELGEIVPLANLIMPKYIQSKRFSVLGDPYLSWALTDSIIESGGEIDHAVFFSKPGAEKNLISYKEPAFNILYEPRCGEVYELWDKSKTDVFIGNSYAFHLFMIKDKKEPFIEFGFPSFYHHCLVVHPFLGFRGYINLLNYMINYIH
ncbi:MAG: hypothetical protein JW827_12105 [Spirochaetes bacterium]|nr:hypothetical protein [Spirochaetota bacterium]